MYWCGSIGFLFGAEADQPGPAACEAGEARAEAAGRAFGRFGARQAAHLAAVADAAPVPEYFAHIDVASTQEHHFGAAMLAVHDRDLLMVSRRKTRVVFFQRAAVMAMIQMSLPFGRLRRFGDLTQAFRMSSQFDQSAFGRTYQGRLHGLLRWPQWEAVCANLRATGSWFVYDLAEALPEQPLSGTAFTQALARIDAILREEHPEDYFGLAYVDDPQAPSLTKIYHPRRMGSVCGSSGRPTLPGWVISSMPPVELAPAPDLEAGGWRSWLRW